MPLADEQREPAPPREPITDSPWFWFALFSVCGLAALLATGGKFGKRQAGIERRYQARAAVASGQVRVEETATGEKRAAGVPEYVTPQRPAIPVWPLEIILGLIAAGSIMMLLRQRRGALLRAAPP
jgi:hypothetical protein